MSRDRKVSRSANRLGLTSLAPDRERLADASEEIVPAPEAMESSLLVAGERHASRPARLEDDAGEQANRNSEG